VVVARYTLVLRCIPRFHRRNTYRTNTCSTAVMSSARGAAVPADIGRWVRRCWGGCVVDVTIRVEITPRWTHPALQLTDVYHTHTIACSALRHTCHHATCLRAWLVCVCPSGRWRRARGGGGLEPGREVGLTRIENNMIQVGRCCKAVWCGGVGLVEQGEV
jgi:hypothetical protein